MIAFDLLKQEEGFRQKVYPDIYGNDSIGYGRCLVTKGITSYEAVYMYGPGTTPAMAIERLRKEGISREHAEYLLNNDIREAVQKLQTLPFWLKMNEARRAVLINMSVNMGGEGVMGFKKMMAAIGSEDWEKADFEMLHSKWAIQLPERCRRMRQIMITGVID